MARVKRGVESRRKHKKVLKLAKGYRGARSRTFKVAKQAVTELVSMHIEIEGSKKEILDLCGLLESTRQLEKTA